MKERPILFSGPMVRAILEGRKTMTRRVVKLRYGADVVVTNGQVWKPARVDYAGYVDCPYGKVGDRLWVRETWNRFEPWAGFFYAADDHSFGIGCGDDPDHIEPHNIKWKPSIHMPRIASRILLEITGVRVERLQDISQNDAISEGAPPSHPSIDRVSRDLGYQDFSRSWYAQLWDQINGSNSWATNPWVWVVEFKRIEP